MNIERLKKIQTLIIVAAGILIFGYVGAKYILPLALPFLIGWAIAFFSRPVAHFLQKHIRMPARLLRVFIALLFTVGILTALGFFLFRVVSEAIRLIGDLAASDSFEVILSYLLDPLGAFFPEGEVGVLEESIANAISAMLANLAGRFGALLGSIAAAVPEIVLFLLVSVISSVYFSYDLENINQKTLALLPRRLGAWLVRFKDGFLKTAVRYLRSYLILGLITFAIMTIAFALFGVKYALALGLLVALLDALPVIGVGTVLVPWGVFRLFLGDMRLGISLLVLFVFNAILRQFIEPKIIGDSLGIPPIVSLVLLYVTYGIFGIAGVFLIPVFTVVLRVLFGKNLPLALPKNDTAPVEERPV